MSSTDCVCYFLCDPDLDLPKFVTEQPYRLICRDYIDLYHGIDGGNLVKGALEPITPALLKS